MKSSPRSTRLGSVAALAALAWAACSTSTFAVPSYDIGLGQLRAEAPTLLGTGVIVAQPEAPLYGDVFEVDPVVAGVSAPITYVNGSGAQVSFNPNNTSDHATTVAYVMANTGAGMAPNLAGILNYNANYFIDRVVQNFAIPQSPKVVNQSFVMAGLTAPFTAEVLGQAWDSFVATQTVSHGAIIVTAAGNGGDIQVPATAYNVISVGAYGGYSSSSEAGQRAKPDITAPGMFTSFSTPIVSGAAALLVQAATGPNYTNASDPRVIKAVLLNGATKPGDWTHDSATPLDRRYGAGIVNVYNSYLNLMAGKHTVTAVTRTDSVGGPHAPITSGDVGAVGWNRRVISSYDDSDGAGAGDGVDHYVINLTQNPAGVPLILTATLTWQRAANDALTGEIVSSTSTTSSFITPVNTINNLDLYLYDANTQALVDQSFSPIDNVEHLYTLNLAPDKYDLQVLKNGGNAGTPNVFSLSETYGLAWSAASITTLQYVTNNTQLVFGQTSSIGVPASIMGTGTLTQSGPGTTTLTGAANYGGPTIVSAGKLNFSGGVSHSIAGVSGGGALVVDSSTSVTADGINMPLGSLSVGGSLVIRSSATPAYTKYATGHATDSLSGTSKLAASGLTVTGALDITNNAFILEATDAASRQAAIANAASLLGTKITSSTAASSSRYTMAIIDNSRLGAANFGGVGVDSFSVILTEALKGDANMDGVVNTSDLLVWKANFNAANAYSVSRGDFNADGIVNTSDLLVWKANFNASVTLYPAPSDGGTGGLGTLSLPVGTGGTNTVPEPASLAVLALGAVGLLARRSKRRFTH